MNEDTRTVDANVTEIKGNKIKIKTVEGEEKTIKKDLLSEVVDVGDTLEVVVKDKKLSHKVTKARLITRGENSIELLKLLGLASIVLVICFIVAYSGFLSYWINQFKEVMMNGTQSQALHIADIMTNLIGVFIIATTLILTIIWKLFVRDEDMQSDGILKLLGIVTIATIICYIIVYLSFYSSWSHLIHTVMINGVMTDKLLVSTIMSKLLGIFVIGSVLILNIIWGFYSHHKEFVKSIDSKKE